MFTSTAWTSRNWSVSAPATRPVCQVAPPSVVRSQVPWVPLAQATSLLTGLIAMSRAVVPLDCSIAVGVTGPGGGTDAGAQATTKRMARCGFMKASGFRMNGVLTA